MDKNENADAGGHRRFAKGKEVKNLSRRLNQNRLHQLGKIIGWARHIGVWNVRIHA